MKGVRWEQERMGGRQSDLFTITRINATQQQKLREHCPGIPFLWELLKDRHTVGTARSQWEDEAETAGAGVVCSDDSHSSQGAGDWTQPIATALQNSTCAASNSCSKAAVCDVGCCILHTPKKRDP